MDRELETIVHRVRIEEVSAVGKVADYYCLSPFLVHRSLYFRIGENQPVPPFFLAATLNRAKRVNKQVVDETTDEECTLPEELQKPSPLPTVPTVLEKKIDQILADLTTEWKQQAMRVVFGLINTSGATEEGVAPISHYGTRNYKRKPRK
ncbi:hypothetical protein R1sor_003188 [Riccia sorocarpa]|uniref:Uncharacterized protein n=1 Tax=Riccia sorocarpa TaxID=122646 RepID=A0ABD3H512_9MARC